jgi:hypothetical protein
MTPNGKTARPLRATYKKLEEMARMKVQEFIQDISNKEIAKFFGQGKSERVRVIEVVRKTTRA